MQKIFNVRYKDTEFSVGLIKNLGWTCQNEVIESFEQELSVNYYLEKLLASSRARTVIGDIEMYFLLATRLTQLLSSPKFYTF